MGVSSILIWGGGGKEGGVLHDSCGARPFVKMIKCTAFACRGERLRCQTLELLAKVFADGYTAEMQHSEP